DPGGAAAGSGPAGGPGHDGERRQRPALTWWLIFSVPTARAGSVCPAFRVAERTVMTATATRPSPVPEEGAAGSELERRKSRIMELLLSRVTMFAFVFILSCVLCFTVFRIGPGLYGMVLRFGWCLLAGWLRFSGVVHYVRLFQDDVFWDSLRVTAIYALLAIPVSFVLSVAM